MESYLVLCVNTKSTDPAEGPLEWRGDTAEGQDGSRACGLDGVKLGRAGVAGTGPIR